MKNISSWLFFHGRRISENCAKVPKTDRQIHSSFFSQQMQTSTFHFLHRSVGYFFYKEELKEQLQAFRCTLLIVVENNSQSSDFFENLILKKNTYTFIVQKIFSWNFANNISFQHAIQKMWFHFWTVSEFLRILLVKSMRSQCADPNEIRTIFYIICAFRYMMKNIHTHFTKILEDCVIEETIKFSFYRRSVSFNNWPITSLTLLCAISVPTCHLEQNYLHFQHLHVTCNKNDTLNCSFSLGNVINLR